MRVCLGMRLTFLRFVLMWCAAWSGAMYTPVVYAATKPQINYVPGGGNVTPSAITAANASMQRTMADIIDGVTGLKTGAVSVSDVVPEVKVGAASVDMSISRQIPWPAIRKIALAGVATASAVGTVAAALELANMLRCHRDPFSGPELGGLLKCDPGTTAPPAGPAVYVTEYRYYFNHANGQSTSAWGTSQSGACTALFSSGPQPPAAQDYVWIPQWISGGNPPYCRIIYDWTGTPGCNEGCTVYSPGMETRQTLQSPEGGQCPSYTDFFHGLQPAGAAKGPDGKCPTGVYQYENPVTVGDRFAPYDAEPAMQPAKNKAKPALEQAVNSGVDATPHALPGVLSGPATATSPPTTTTTNTGAGTKTETVARTHGITYPGDNSYTTTDTVTTTTVNPDGTTTTTTTTGASGNQEFYTCGWPGKPPCKIDEQGTPQGSAAGELAGAKSERDAAGDAIKGMIEDPEKPTTLGWNFTTGIFGIQTGSCSPFTWGSRIGTLTYDACSNSLINTVRQMLAWLMWGITILYVWRRVNESVENA